MKRQSNQHHVKPRSRDHSSKRTVELPKGFHTAIHIVFGNLYGDEMVYFIQELNRLMKTKSSITGKELEEIRNKVKERRC